MIVVGRSCKGGEVGEPERLTFGLNLIWRKEEEVERWRRMRLMKKMKSRFRTEQVPRSSLGRGQ